MIKFCFWYYVAQIVVDFVSSVRGDVKYHDTDYSPDFAYPKKTTLITQKTSLDSNK